MESQTRQKQVLLAGKMVHFGHIRNPRHWHIFFHPVNERDSTREIRQIEKGISISEPKWVKVIIIMTSENLRSAMKDPFREHTTAYLVKPFVKLKLIEEIGKIDLIT